MPALAILILGVLGAWAVDLTTSVVRLFEARGGSAMDAANRRYAFAKVIVLAALADGNLSANEWEVLRKLRKEHRSFDDDPELIVRATLAEVEALRAGDSIENLVRGVAGPLGRKEREVAMEVVRALAENGSRIAAASRGGDYRAPPTAGPAELVRTFERALGLDAD